ncbi:hypothetical protein AC86_5136 [Escherichia coli 3-073-06_S4_C1]|nr:hypothetical protein AC86_5136 [Escherichia coli 3-073-06_S4_C1]
MFPAPAGINRRAALVFLTWRRVPRASGDKPTRPAVFTDAQECSPRQRG